MYLVSLHFLCAAGTLLCPAGYYSTSPPPSNNFVQCIGVEIPVQSVWGYCLSPPGIGYFSGHSSSSELDPFGFWLMIFQTLLPLAGSFCLCLCFAYKNVLQGAQFSRYIWPFDHFHQNWIITEVLVCCICGLHDIVLENGKVSLFPDLFFCLAFLFSLGLLHRWSFAQVFYLPHLDYYVTFSSECRLLCFQLLGFTFLVRWNAPC